MTGLNGVRSIHITTYTTRTHIMKSKMYFLLILNWFINKSLGVSSRKNIHLIYLFVNKQNKELKCGSNLFWSSVQLLWAFSYSSNLPALLACSNAVRPPTAICSRFQWPVACTPWWWRPAHGTAPISAAPRTTMNSDESWPSVRLKKKS